MGIEIRASLGRCAICFHCDLILETTHYVMQDSDMENTTDLRWTQYKKIK